MRAWLLLPVLAAGCLEAGTTPTEDQPDMLDLSVEERVSSPTVATMVTWNLKTYPLSAETPGAVVNLVDHWQDDLMAVEEIMDLDTFQAMVDAIPGYEALLNDDPGGYMRVGLLYNTERVTLDSVETLFKDDYYAFPRPPLKVHATIDLEDSGPIDFHVVVVHLKSQVGSGTEERRAAAAVKLDEWVTHARATFEDKDIVILGDFNQQIRMPIDTSEWEPFLSQPDVYRFLTYEGNTQGGFTQLSFKGFLDQIVVTTDALDEYGTGETTVLDLRDAVYRYQQSVSDHLPVRAAFVPPIPARRALPN